MGQGHRAEHGPPSFRKLNPETYKDQARPGGKKPQRLGMEESERECLNCKYQECYLEEVTAELNEILPRLKLFREWGWGGEEWRV